MENMQEKEKVLAIAKEKAVSMGYVLEKHNISIEQDGNNWLIAFTPKELILGGGVEIWIQKKDHKVIKAEKVQ